MELLRFIGVVTLIETLYYISLATIIPRESFFWIILLLPLSPIFLIKDIIAIDLILKRRIWLFSTISILISIFNYFSQFVADEITESLLGDSIGNMVMDNLIPIFWTGYNKYLLVLLLILAVILYFKDSAKISALDIDAKKM